MKMTWLRMSACARMTENGVRLFPATACAIFRDPSHGSCANQQKQLSSGCRHSTDGWQLAAVVSSRTHVARLKRSRKKQGSLVHSGSLKIARRTQDAEVIRADFERWRRMGLDVEMISLKQPCRLNPFLKPTGVVVAGKIDDDRYFDRRGWLPALPEQLRPRAQPYCR
jgi:hypothetical protein